MKQQQNLKAPSAKYCIVEGHQMEIVNHVCINKYCKSSNNRWICIKCALQKKHQQGVFNNIVDQEMFYNLLKNQQENNLEYIKQIQQQVMCFIKKLKIVFDDINLTLQQLENEITALKENHNLKLIDQIIQMTEEDFSQISNQQILEFHNSKICLKEDFYLQFNENMGKIRRNIHDIIEVIPQKIIFSYDLTSYNQQIYSMKAS